mmetsp:Transcript_1723/g.5388  ORF Transcript_1723/g.5388 Transcript_1723/m.5388 type:complete len:348 (-) Transcript_1723:87-1130(-)
MSSSSSGEVPGGTGELGSLGASCSATLCKARSTAVAPWSSVALILAPWRNSSLTALGWPPRAAKCRAVCDSFVRSSRCEASCLDANESSFSSTRSLPAAAAWCTAFQPVAASASNGSAPQASKSVAVSIAPAPVAPPWPLAAAALKSALDSVRRYASMALEATWRSGLSSLRTCSRSPSREAMRSRSEYVALMAESAPRRDSAPSTLGSAFSRASSAAPTEGASSSELSTLAALAASSGPSSANPGRAPFRGAVAAAATCTAVCEAELSTWKRRAMTSALSELTSFCSLLCSTCCSFDCSVSTSCESRSCCWSASMSSCWRRDRVFSSSTVVRSEDTFSCSVTMAAS